MLYRLLIILIIFVAFASCSKTDENRLSYEEVWESRKKDFLDEKVKKCIANALNEAEIHVDSMSTVWMKEINSDTIDFPSKPSRPERPEDIFQN